MNCIMLYSKVLKRHIFFISVTTFIFAILNNIKSKKGNQTITIMIFINPAIVMI